MGLLSKLGLKKERKKDPVVARSGSDEARPNDTVGQATPKETGLLRLTPRNDNAYQILVRPVLSEKGTSLAGKGKYVFVVHPKANKSEIRKSIQAVYDVHVRAVKILKMPGKSRHYGRTVGRTSAFKKAIVVLRVGEKIPGIIEAVG